MSLTPHLKPTPIPPSEKEPPLLPTGHGEVFAPSLLLDEETPLILESSDFHPLFFLHFQGPNSFDLIISGSRPRSLSGTGFSTFSCGRVFMWRPLHFTLDRSAAMLPLVVVSRDRSSFLLLLMLFERFGGVIL